MRRHVPAITGISWPNYTHHTRRPQGQHGAVDGLLKDLGERNEFIEPLLEREQPLHLALVSGGKLSCLAFAAQTKRVNQGDCNEKYLSRQEHTKDEVGDRAWGWLDRVQ